MQTKNHKSSELDIIQTIVSTYDRNSEASIFLPENPVVDVYIPLLIMPSKVVSLEQP